MKHLIFALGATALLGACAQTSVQTMSADTFQVSATTAPACGRAGAADVTSKMAAMQVIRMGGDRYVIEDARTGSEWGGGLLIPMQRAQQSAIVRILQPNDPRYATGLSARQILGNDWANMVASGNPNFC